MTLPPSFRPEGADFSPVETVNVPEPEAQHIEWLISLSREAGTEIKTEKAWDLVKHLWGFWAKWHVYEYQAWAQDMNRLKKEQTNEWGVLEGEMEVRHIMELPKGFVNLLMRFFPDQKLEDRKFQKQFLKRMPIFQVPDKI